MGQLIKVLVEVEKLRGAKQIEGKTGRKYFPLMVDVSDRVDQFGNHVSAYSEQTKEERDAKTPRHYVGNGKVVYGHGKMDRPADDGFAPAPSKAKQADDDLPF